MAVVTREFYEGTYGGIIIASNDEFNKLSARAEALIDSYVQSQVLNWKYADYENIKDIEISIKTAICQEIEVLFHSNGMQAVTGGADAGEVELFGGVPLSVMAKQNILQTLLEKNILYKGV